MYAKMVRMTTATTMPLDLIVSDPAIRRGVPVLAGTTLRVTDVAVAHIYHDRSASEIASDYALSLGQVHAALAYYYEHHEALNAEIRAQTERAEAYKEKRVGSRYPALLPR